MYEYKVETYNLKEAEERINEFAKLGWKVIAVTSNLESLTKVLVVTFEKQVR